MEGDTVTSMAPEQEMLLIQTCPCQKVKLPGNGHAPGELNPHAVNSLRR